MRKPKLKLHCHKRGTRTEVCLREQSIDGTGFFAPCVEKTSEKTRNSLVEKDLWLRATNPCSGLAICVVFCLQD